MKMHEILREKRKAKGLTQAQIADMLNVSAPAVNQWER
ncbi:MAG: helix-turn-helix transcriptional regulator, partial [Oscillospiraceae bacterium]